MKVRHKEGVKMSSKNFYINELKKVGITVHAMKSIELMGKDELKVLYEKHCKK